MTSRTTDITLANHRGGFHDRFPHCPLCTARAAVVEAAKKWEIAYNSDEASGATERIALCVAVLDLRALEDDHA